VRARLYAIQNRRPAIHNCHAPRNVIQFTRLARLRRR